MLLTLIRVTEKREFRKTKFFGVKVNYTTVAMKAQYISYGSKGLFNAPLAVIKWLALNFNT